MSHVICAFCKGDGKDHRGPKYFFDRDPDPCKICKGAGKVEIPNATECAFCKGSGKDKSPGSYFGTNPNPCKVCHGVGHVSVRKITA